MSNYEIKITRTDNPKQKPQDQSKLGFGKIFTDHMFEMEILSRINEREDDDQY